MLITTIYRLNRRLRTH